jgi:hypothetical protein
MPRVSTTNDVRSMSFSPNVPCIAPALRAERLYGESPGFPPAHQLPCDEHRSAGGRVVTATLNVITGRGLLFVTPMASVEFRRYLDVGSRAIVPRCKLVTWSTKRVEPELCRSAKSVRLRLCMPREHQESENYEGLRTFPGSRRAS